MTPCRALVRLLVLVVPLAFGAAARAQGPVVHKKTFRLFLPIASPPAAAVVAVAFSPRHGFYDVPIAVTLSTSSPGARIRYTLDGRPPTPEVGFDYAGPIRLDRTTVLRAAAFRPSRDPSAVGTQTYLFAADVLTQPEAPGPAFPPTWGVYPPGSVRRLAGQPVPADYAMDPDVVNDPRTRDTIAGDLRAIPSLSIATAPENLFAADAGIYANPLEEGPAWERPVSVELIDPVGGGFQVDAGLRIAGGWSRKPDSQLKHAFSLRFRSAYGASRLRYPLFGGSPVRSFDTLRLRAGQADSFLFSPYVAQYAFDEWGRRTQLDMGWLSARGTWVHLYLDGLYWGLYNLAEEPTAAFVADHAGGAADDVDVLKDHGEVEDGAAAAYEAMRSAVLGADLADPVAYRRAAALLDFAQHADYTLLQIFGANQDWAPEKNWRAARDRVLGGGFQFFVWDMGHVAPLHEYATDCPDGKRTCDIAATAGIDGLHGALKASPEYRLLFADRARRNLFDGGPLAPERAGARFAAVTGEIERAIVTESARWGDVTPGERTRADNPVLWKDFCPRPGPCPPQTRDDHWRPRREILLADFFPRRTAIVVGQLCREGLYPPVTAPAFAATPSSVTMAAGTDGCPGAVRDGDIYYTLDGADPRRPFSGTPGAPWSGVPAASARVYRGPVALTGFVRVKARLRVGDVWSALTEASLGPPRLAFTEVMYRPAGGDADEFVELKNLEAATVDLSGYGTGGITYTFAAGTELPAGGYLVLAADTGAFRTRYPDTPLAGVYRGKLADGGERLTVEDPDGRVVAALEYDDEGLWPLGPDGWGYSLVPEDEGGDPTDPEAWRASARPNGSPGGPDPQPPYGRAVVNEVLAASAPPLEDAIEVWNPTGAPVDVGGWYLSDDPAEPQKFRIPAGRVLAPHGFAVFYEAHFGAGAAAFGLSSDGETAVLSSADGAGNLTGSIRGATFGAEEPGVSLGRVRTSVGVDFVALVTRTFGVDDPATVEAFRTGRGAPNAAPKVGPIVLGEVMYHPEAGEDEFVELHNPTAAPVVLSDPSDPSIGWALADAVSFTFPAGTQIAPGGYLLVVPDAAAAMRLRQQRGVPAEVPILMPLVGKLDNAGERVALMRPRAGGSAGDPLILVDHVAYDDAPPWPALADGEGPSLERLAPDLYGNEPLHWSALHPGGTPGRANTVPRRAYFPLAANGW